MRHRRCTVSALMTQGAVERFGLCFNVAGQVGMPLLFQVPDVASGLSHTC